MTKKEIFFNKDFNIEKHSIHISESDFFYLILIKSDDDSFIFSFRVKIGRFERILTIEEEELLTNLVLKRINFNNQRVFSTISDLFLSLNDLKDNH
jgi:hypothetical protein